MSYSFGVTAANKTEAKQLVEVEFDKVVVMFPIHGRDKAAVLANADAVLYQLDDDESKDVSVTVNGFLNWSGCDNVGDAKVQSAMISAYASIVDRKPQA